MRFLSTVGITLFPWQADVAQDALKRERGKFVYTLAGISVPRGNGKSFLAAAVGLWLLITGKAHRLVLCCALDYEGAKVVLDHAKKILQQCPVLNALVDVQTNSIFMPSTGGRVMVTSREHTASRGLHPDVIIYDEGGWVRDAELFDSLLASQASVEDPLFLMVSTMGKRKLGPLWTIKTLAEGGDPRTFWWWTGENLSPKVTQEFLDQQRSRLMPAAFAREHQNQAVDAADSFTSSAVVDAAMGHGWVQQGYGHHLHSYVCFVDLGFFHDATAVAVGHEEGGMIYLDRLDTFLPRKGEPVQVADVERHLLFLCARFTITQLRIESHQGVASVQHLQRLNLEGTDVQLDHRSAKKNAEDWPVLHQRLETRTLVLPSHFRLREELLNLTYEVGPQGVKVTDPGKIHQDHAVTVRGVCAMLNRPQVNPEISAPVAGGHRETGGLVQGARWEMAPSPSAVSGGPSIDRVKGYPTDGIDWGSKLW